MDNKEQPKPDSAYDSALQRFREEQQWFERERELLEEVENPHQSKWELLMRRVGRL